MFDALLDRTIVLSFDRNGYHRHARHFIGEDVDLSGQVVVVTGGNAGIGRAIAHSLAVDRAEVWLVCRNVARGEEARAHLVAETGNPAIHVAIADMSVHADVRRLAERLPPHVHAIIHNAGALLDHRELTPDGLERTYATHVTGPFLLTALLAREPDPQGPRFAPDARVVWVSSGGMYTQRLDLAALTATTGPFDGVRAYALAKRAQVILNERLAERLGPRVWTAAMHPGWANTGGVRTSLPRFWSLTRSILRTAEEGADTAAWLAVRARGPSGRFWFDRAEVPAHLWPRTHESAADRDARLADVCEKNGVDVP